MGENAVARVGQVFDVGLVDGFAIMWKEGVFQKAQQASLWCSSVMRGGVPTQAHSLWSVG